jgi:hypothetical protein
MLSPNPLTFCDLCVFASLFAYASLAALPCLFSSSRLLKSRQFQLNTCEIARSCYTFTTTLPSTPRVCEIESDSAACSMHLGPARPHPQTRCRCRCSRYRCRCPSPSSPPTGSALAFCAASCPRASPSRMAAPRFHAHRLPSPLRPARRLNSRSLLLPVC